ncbi:alpha/beta hydrolase [Halomonas coralii]|uniref:alpha/beta fold hydrolase n=1 Tax=Modicisalibacter sp. R2A 31.J TaxID=2831898 RepID=UPI001CCA4107|nr:alpha/beta hydrolase [Modicisalibacter sp. R2A 31.J]MBZ9557337.1 alpha/beta hydrolase [Modicisalibacter sp. R2A 31.J]
MVAITNQESWVMTPKGRLFVKRWVPSEEECVKKTPIVLFHDSLGCVELWRDFPQAISLATKREVIAYDRLGFGQSAPYPGELPVSFVADEANGAFSALLQSLGIEDFIAFGHSVGGGMACVCAAAFPERCRALITESAQAFVEDRTLEGIREAKKVFAQPGQLERLKKYHGDKADWVLSAWVNTWLSDAFRHWNLSESLTRVKCPVLAIHGDSDEYGSTQHPERIASLPSGPTTTRILQDCGHVPHREKAEVVVEATKAFLAQNGLGNQRAVQ